MPSLAIVAAFIAGLMVGRTPEYLGKEIEPKEVKMALLAILILPLAILGLTAIVTVVPAGLAGPDNAGPHGFTEILYGVTPQVPATTAAPSLASWPTRPLQPDDRIAMLLGRFFFIVPTMAVAGSLAAKKLVPLSARPSGRCSSAF